MMIIPAVFVFFGMEGMGSGPSLMFISLPKVFAAMGGAGKFVGILFFVMVVFAALTSCISIMETLVANCMEIFHAGRKKVCIGVAVFSIVTAIIICLGYNVFYFEAPLPNGSTGQLLDIADYISNSFLMPLISFLTCIFIGWVFHKKKIYEIMVKYVAPVMMGILFLQSTGIFGILGWK